MSSAAYAAFPPGAAQASRTRMPGRGSRSRTTSWDASSWTLNLPSSHPGARADRCRARGPRPARNAPLGRRLRRQTGDQCRALPDVPAARSAPLVVGGQERADRRVPKRACQRSTSQRGCERDRGAPSGRGGVRQGQRRSRVPRGGGQRSPSRSPRARGASRDPRWSRRRRAGTRSRSAIWYRPSRAPSARADGTSRDRDRRMRELPVEAACQASVP
jgi:hypothetical protein